MDIARPELKWKKRRRQIPPSTTSIILFDAATTFAVSRLEPAAAEVERSTASTHAVKHGSMLRQVLGLDHRDSEPGVHSSNTTNDRGYGRNHTQRSLR
jgi:hypothetical protein